MENTPLSQGQPSLEKVADHVFPREVASLVGVVVGIVIGIGNAMLGLLFPSWLATLGLLCAALALVLVLHEGLHGAAGMLFGYRPIFGIQPPLVFTTFKEKIARNHLAAIALAPLVILDAAFVTAFVLVPGEIFWDLCFAVNTIGAVGDVWIVTRVLSHPPETVFQDTKSGVEAWLPLA